MHAVLMDLDGVIYQDEELIPGAPQAVAWLREQRIPFAFVTNTTSAPRLALVAKLASIGIAVEPGQVFTPAIAAAHWLQDRSRQPAALFVPEATRADFGPVAVLDEGAESGAGSVVIGDLSTDWNFARLNRAFRLLMHNPTTPLVALGATRFWRAGDGLRLDVGPFVAALECSTTRRAVVLGKPSSAFFELAVGSLQRQPAHSIMIGDDIAVDVRGAQRAGLRGLLVRTGKFDAADLSEGPPPDGILASVAQLPEWWQRHAEGSMGR